MKQVMKKRMKTIVAGVLVFAITFANVDVVNAAVVESVEDAAVEDVSVNDVTGSDISGGDTFETADVMNTATAENVLYYGTQAGITWSITSDGLLTIEGEYDAESGESITLSWLTYKTQIKKAVVTAKKVKSTGSWFAGCTNLAEIDVKGLDTSAATSMSYMFEKCSSLTSLDLSGLDTGNVTNMGGMFSGCSGLTSLNLSGLDTGNATNMTFMFKGCRSLTSLDVSGFDTGNVTTMYGMFWNCKGLTSLDVNSWDTGNVTTMTLMFASCEGLASLDVSGWDTGRVTSMYCMFTNCSGLTSLDVSGWDTGSVTSMYSMFSDCSGLTSLDVSGFKTDNVTDMLYMFSGCDNLMELNCMPALQLDCELPHTMQDEFGNVYDTNLPKNLSESVWLYTVASKSVELNWLITDLGTLCIIGEYNASEADTVTTWPWLDYADSIKKVVVTATGVETTDHWFEGCSNLKEVILSGFDMSKVKSADAMFAGCNQIEHLNTPKKLAIDVVLPAVYGNGSGVGYTSLPKNMTESILLTKAIGAGTYCEMDWLIEAGGHLTIYGAYGLTADTDTSWKVYGDQVTSAKIAATGVTNTYHWFNVMTNMKHIDLGEFDSSKVFTMNEMFYNCKSLEQVDVSKFNTSNVKNMYRMFYGCSRLTELNLSSFDMAAVTDATEMLAKCTSLEQIQSPINLTIDVPLPDAFFDDKGEAYWSLPKNQTESFSLKRAVETGTYYGMDWAIDEEGTLFITGTYGAPAGTDTIWTDYADQIVSVKVTATGVTSTVKWFYELDNLKYVDLSEFDSSNVTDMNRMFYKCTSLTELGLDRFDTSKVTNMDRMFSYCTSLKALDVSKFNTSNVTNMNGMFHNCSSLTNLDVSHFDLKNVTTADDMLTLCNGIQEICMPANLSTDIKVPKTLYNYLGEPQSEVFSKYQPEAEWYYAVSPVKEGEIHVSKVYAQTYTGKAIKPEIRIYDGANRLLDKKDFTINYKNNTKANDASDIKTAPTIIVKGKGNYTKQDTVTFQILAKDVADADVTVTELVAVAGKKVQTPVPKLTYNGKKLVNKKDFTVSYPDMGEENPDAYKAPGTYRVVVTGKGNFTGTRELTFTITGGTLMSKTKIDKIPKQTYTGSAIEPEIRVTHGKKVLEKGTDYTVCYTNNVEIGKATVIVSGMGDYAGSKTATFQVVGQSIAKAKVEGIVSKTYNGQEQTQNITVTLKGQEKPLVAGTDYEVVYTKNINAGTATMTITGVGSYTGKIKKTFKINAYDLTLDESKLLAGVPENLTATYEKGGSKPVLALTFDGVAMAVKTDYTISYANNMKVAEKNAAKAPTIIVKGKGNFKGSVKIPFNIVAKDLQDAENPVKMNVPDVPYSKTKGKFISKPVLTDSNGKRLVVGTDYDKNIVYTLADGTVLDKKSVVEAGQTVTVAVTGKGNYKGTITATYRVTPASFKNAKVSIATQVYTGKEITLSEEDFTSVKIGKDTLTYGQEYEIVEGSYKNNLKKGTASVTIRGKGNYGGTKTVKFKIVAREMIWFWKMFD